MSEGGQLETDMVFLGLTRPSMLFGVGYSVVLMNFFACMMGYVITNNFRAFLLLIFLHGVSYVATQKEPLFLELFMIRQQRCNKCSNRLYHGLTNSYDVM